MQINNINKCRWESTLGGGEEVLWTESCMELMSLYDQVE